MNNHAHGLVWYRSDLRCYDHEALSTALRQCKYVSALYILSPKQWADHGLGNNKINLLLRSLTQLHAQLSRLNIALQIKTSNDFDGQLDTLIKHVTDHKVDALYFNEEYELNEKQRDLKLEKKIATLFPSIVNYCFNDQSLLHPKLITTQSKSFYTVFTPFKKAWEKQLANEDAIKVFAVPRKQEIADTALHQSLVNTSLTQLEQLPLSQYPVSQKILELWPAGEKHAQKQLNHFVQNTTNSYQMQRDYPALDAGAKLSPYLNLGIISIKHCFATAYQNTGPGVDCWVNELIWREFYRYVVFHFPRVSKNQCFKANYENIPWRNNTKHYQAWCEGKTGYPIVDAAMQQLLTTGFMHNRLRMIVAMFFCKDLHLEWRLGEAFFMQHLIDADLASNNGGWQWSASTGTDAAPYFRIFNPLTQSERFDPDAKFIKTYLPILKDSAAKDIHQIIGLPKDYPKIIVNHNEARQITMQLYQKIKS